MNLQELRELTGYPAPAGLIMTSKVRDSVELIKPLYPWAQRVLDLPYQIDDSLPHESALKVYWQLENWLKFLTNNTKE